MALLWQHIENNTTYQVRQAGGSVRLYTNGVFHSQWNASRPIANALWDLLCIPAFFLANEQPTRVLMLGVGGGAAIRQLQTVFSPSHVIGVDLDAVHLKVAREWFGVEDLRSNAVCRTELVCGDAFRWLSDYRGQPFDYIVDDLFGHVDGRACRAIPASQEWVRLLERHASEKSVIALNFQDRRQLIAAAEYFDSPSSTNVYQFSHPRYHNRIAAVVRQGSSLSNMQERIARCGKLPHREKKILASYRCKKIDV